MFGRLPSPWGSTNDSRGLVSVFSGLLRQPVFARAGIGEQKAQQGASLLTTACASDALGGPGNGGLNRANRAIHRYRVGNRVNARLVRAVAGRAGTEGASASACGSCNHRSPRQRAMPVLRCCARFTILHPMSDEPRQSARSNAADDCGSIRRPHPTEPMKTVRDRARELVG